MFFAYIEQCYCFCRYRKERKTISVLLVAILYDMIMTSKIEYAVGSQCSRRVIQHGLSTRMQVFWSGQTTQFIRFISVFPAPSSAPNFWYPFNYAEAWISPSTYPVSPTINPVPKAELYQRYTWRGDLWIAQRRRLPRNAFDRHKHTPLLLKRQMLSWQIPTLK
jgi:hypothetical protein